MITTVPNVEQWCKVISGSKMLAAQRLPASPSPPKEYKVGRAKMYLYRGYLRR